LKNHPELTVVTVKHQTTIERASGMVFSSDDKAVIKNDFEEKGWTAYRIWKEHPSKGWVLSSVQRLVKRFKVTGTMERKTGSGRPITATTEENGDLVELLVCSQEEPGTHKSPQEVAPMIGISRSSVKRLVRDWLEQED